MRRLRRRCKNERKRRQYLKLKKYEDKLAAGMERALREPKPSGPVAIDLETIYGGQAIRKTPLQKTMVGHIIHDEMLRSPEGMEEIVADVEDLMAERMERALIDGYTPWMAYTVQNVHRDGPRPGAEDVAVRIRHAGQVKVELELRYYRNNFETHIYPEATEWFFLGVENEEEARAVREPNDRPLKPY